MLTASQQALKHGLSLEVDRLGELIDKLENKVFYLMKITKQEHSKYVNKQTRLFVLLIHLATRFQPVFNPFGIIVVTASKPHPSINIINNIQRHIQVD